jgi:hypothetical protein
MKKRPFAILALLITFVLIGTANADWIAQTITTPPVMPEQLGLISLGAAMVAVAVLGRTRLKRPSATKTQAKSTIP